MPGSAQVQLGRDKVCGTQGEYLPHGWWAQPQKICAGAGIAGPPGMLFILPQIYENTCI